MYQRLAQAMININNYPKNIKLILFKLKKVYFKNTSCAIK